MHGLITSEIDVFQYRLFYSALQCLLLELALPDLRLLSFYMLRDGLL